jgi:hypothetical protein
MKKLVLFLALILTVGLAMGQTSDLKPGKKGVSVETPASFTPIIDDTTDIVYINYDMSEREEVYYYTLGARLWATKVSATVETQTMTILEQYSLDGRIYADLDTLTFTGTVADTTFHFLENSTKVGYPFLRLKIVGDDSISTQLNVATGRFIK